MKANDRVRLVSMVEIEKHANRLHAPHPRVSLGALGTVIKVGFDGLADVKFDPVSEYSHSDVILCDDTMVEVVNEES